MIIPQHIGPLNMPVVLPYIAIACVLAFILLLVPILLWAERVFLGYFQDRLGPNRVGPIGILQSIADGMKLFFKEDIEPGNVDLRLYYLAPVFALIPALAAGAAIPFSAVQIKMDSGTIRTFHMVVGDVNIGILFILALTSLQIYGIVLGGWSSNNKYSLLGGLRSSAQIISYELAMTLTIMTGVLISGSLNLSVVVDHQAGYWFGIIPKWNVFQFCGLGFIAAFVYLIAMVAETNRAPFDLPEAESELVAGFHTEYSSMKFAIFFMGEYASMIVVSGVATALWFGGWQPLFPFLSFIPGYLWFIGKVIAIIFTYIWLRATLPRLRYDALMNLGWKRMLPTALVVLFAVAAVDTFLYTSPDIPSDKFFTIPAYMLPSKEKPMMGGTSASGGGGGGGTNSSTQGGNGR